MIIILINKMSGMTPEKSQQFNEAFAAYASTGDEAQLQTCYNIFDLDGNGHIEAEEVGIVLRQLLGNDIPEAKVQEIFQQADVNHDGHIDFNEFCAVIKKFKVD